MRPCAEVVRYIIAAVFVRERSLIEDPGQVFLMFPSPLFMKFSMFCVNSNGHRPIELMSSRAPDARASRDVT